jgi:hypothetical protein
MPHDESPRVVSVSAFASLSAVVSALALAPGCAVAPSAERPSPARAEAVEDAGLSRARRARAMQALALSMADHWSNALGAARTSIPKESTAASRGAAQMALAHASGAALAIGTGSDPGAAILDLLVQSSLQCWVFTANPRGTGVDRPDAERVLAQLNPARTDLWSMASREVDAQTLADLRILVDAWVKAHPDDARVADIRLGDLAAQAGGLGAKERDRAGAMLAAAAARATGADMGELFGERMLWYLAHYPSFLGLQAEATAARIAETGERGARDDRTAFADTMAKERMAFGAILEAERKALASAATTERKAIAGALGEERAALADALAKERAALADALGKEREAVFADVARERAAILEGVAKAVESSTAAAKGEREALSKWASEERTALADDLEARLVKAIDRALIGAGIVVGAMLLGLAILKFIPSRKAG